jgi:hypothetical protein
VYKCTCRAYAYLYARTSRVHRSARQIRCKLLRAHIPSLCRSTRVTGKPSEDMFTANVSYGYPPESLEPNGRTNKACADYNWNDKRITLAFTQQRVKQINPNNNSEAYGGTSRRRSLAVVSAIRRKKNK